MTEKSSTRSHSHEIELDATIEAVWKALIEPAQLKKWYVAGGCPVRC